MTPAVATRYRRPYDGWRESLLDLRSVDAVSTVGWAAVTLVIFAGADETVEWVDLGRRS